MSLPSRARRALERWWAPVVLVLLAFISVGVHVPANVAFSPLDEYVYADYLDGLPERPVVAQGEDTGPEAREHLLCEGNRGVPTPPEPTCAEAATAPSEAFVMEGKTSADIYTPLYFVTTWAVAQPLVWLGMDLLDAASYVGGLWLALGLLLLHGALRALGVPRLVSVALGALVVASPVAYWSSTYVSTDAPSLAVGAALLLAVVRVSQGRSGLVLFAVVSVLGVLLKVQNVAAVAFGALALLIAALGRAVPGPAEGRARRMARSVVTRPVIVAVLSGAAAVTAQVIWLMIRSSIAVAPSPDQGTALPVTVKGVLGEGFKFLSGTPLDPTGGMNGIAIAAAGQVLAWLCVAGVIATAVLARSGTIERSVAWAGFVTSIALGPLLVVGVGLVTHYYFSLPTRYGISLLPAFLASAGQLLARGGRGPAVATAVVAAAFWALSLPSS